MKKYEIPFSAETSSTVARRGNVADFGPAQVELENCGAPKTSNGINTNVIKNSNIFKSQFEVFYLALAFFDGGGLSKIWELRLKICFD